MEIKYTFDPDLAYSVIKDHFDLFCEKNYLKQKVVIGISGGKDSTVLAYLFAKILGPDKVYGVSMPNDGQKDIDDVNKVFELTKINRLDIDIGDAVDSLMTKLENNAYVISDVAKTNLPPRIRMSVLYMVAQTVNGITICSDNLSERCTGYSTLWGDNVGSYAPLKNLTVEEVISLGDWLGVPEELCHKVPSDGLQTKTDEDNLGFKYADLDKFIRTDAGSDDLKKTVCTRFLKNKFKLELADIPGPDIGYRNIVFEYCNFFRK